MQWKSEALVGSRFGSDWAGKADPQMSVLPHSRCRFDSSQVSWSIPNCRFRLTARLATSQRRFCLPCTMAGLVALLAAHESTDYFDGIALLPLGFRLEPRRPRWDHLRLILGCCQHPMPGDMAGILDAPLPEVRESLRILDEAGWAQPLGQHRDRVYRGV